jgi:hypothetical protein
MERPRAPSQQRKPNLSQAPPTEIASAQEQRKERNRFGRLTLCVRAVVGLFCGRERALWASIVGISKPGQTACFLPLYSDDCNSTGVTLVSLCSIFAREWSGSPQPGLKFARRLPWPLWSLWSHPSVWPQMVVREIKLGWCRARVRSSLYIHSCTLLMRNVDGRLIIQIPQLQHIGQLRLAAASELCELHCVLCRTIHLQCTIKAVGAHNLAPYCQQYIPANKTLKQALLRTNFVSTIPI